jgi:hypothetical protein
MNPVLEGEKPCVECRWGWVMLDQYENLDRVDCQHEDTPYHHANYNREEEGNICGPSGKLFTPRKESEHP